MESIRFISNQQEYRIAFLSYDISQCQEIIQQLQIQNLLGELVEVDVLELEKMIVGMQFCQPLAMHNYIVYRISTGKNILSKNDQGFQRKMTALGYRDLPYNICKKGNQYRIQYTERFIYKLFLSQRQKHT